MKILQRRLRISWGWLFAAVLFSLFSVLSLATDEAFLPSRRRYDRAPIKRQTNPRDFYFFLGVHVTLAAVGTVFTRYQFHEGSWFSRR
jgi:hypothetical protein